MWLPLVSWSLAQISSVDAHRVPQQHATRTARTSLPLAAAERVVMPTSGARGAEPATVSGTSEASFCPGCSDGQLVLNSAPLNAVPKCNTPSLQLRL